MKTELLNQLGILGLLLVSTGLIGWGLYQIYPPSCPLGIGLILFSILLLPDRRPPDRRKPTS